MSARRALLRLARRDARQYLRRTVLMLLLIALPIAGTALAATLFTTLRVTGQDRAIAAMGDADLALYADSTVDGQQRRIDEVLEHLGTVDSVEPVAVRVHELRHGSSTMEVAVWSSDESRTGRQMLELVDGTWPDQPGELLVSPTVAAELDARVGDRIELAGDSVELVGLARDRLDLDRRIGVTVLGDATPNAWFVSLPPGASLDFTTVNAIEELGFTPALRTTLMSGSDDESALGIVLLGGLAFVVVALVASAAFAVVAEQRRLDLARLRAVGATPRQLRAAVTASGWVVGVLAAVAGVLAGVAATIVARAPLERLADRAIVQVRVPWAVLGAIAAVGVLTAVVAARAPARRAAAGAAKEALAGSVATRAWERVPVLRVLAGLMGIAGLVAFVVAAPDTGLVGSALITLALVVLGIFGAGGAGQLVISAVTEALRTRIRPTPRIALRDLMRMPSRITPIVTALVAVLALNILIVGFVNAATATREVSGAAVRLGPRHFVIDGPTPAVALPDIRAALPVTQATSLRIVQPYSPNVEAAMATAQLPYVAVATPALVANLGLDDLDADIAAGRTIVVGSGAVPPVLASNGVRAIEPDFWPRDVPPILVPAASLDGAGLIPAREGSRLLVRLDRDVSDADLARAEAIADRYGQRVQGAVPPPSVDAGQVRTLVTAATATVALLVALAGLALLTAEVRSADRTLFELGAPPRLHRRLAAIRALLLCGLAGGLALVIGALALSAVTRTALAAPVGLPTASTVAVTLALPVVAAVVTWAPWRRNTTHSDLPRRAVR